jgi:tRNA(fMet)-specific endonuclease VapC
MIYVLDTNIVIHFVRESPLMRQIESNFNPMEAGNITWLSAVSVGELRSIALQNRWGSKRVSKLDSYLKEFLILEVNIEELHHRYAEIDAFSQGKHPTIASNFSARNMGKNDLWIAATASLLEGTLLTTDGDFNHLDGVFLRLERMGGLKGV